MRGRGASLLAIGLLASLLAAGCQTTPFDDDGVRMRGTRLAIDDARAERALRSYLELVDTRSALRGSARVLIEAPDFKLHRPQRILVERPARLRFEVVGLFDQLAAMLVTDGRIFGFYDVAKGDIARGVVTPTLLWDLAKIDLDVDEVVGLLLAAPVPSPGVARSAVWLEPDGRIAVVFAWPEGEPAAECADAPRRSLFASECFVSVDSMADGGEVFFFDESGRLAEVRDLEPGGAVRYRATFEDYGLHAMEEGANQIEFPNRITLRSPEASSTARFTWKRVMLADELPDPLFMLPNRSVSSRSSVGDG